MTAEELLVKAEDLLDKISQDEGFGNWETVVLNCHHSVIRNIAIAAVIQALHQYNVSGRSEQFYCNCSCETFAYHYKGGDKCGYCGGKA